MSERMTDEDFDRTANYAENKWPKFTAEAIRARDSEATLRAQVEEMRRALEAIADPVGTVTALARKQGHHPVGSVLAELVSHGGWFVGRAKAALSAPVKTENPPRPTSKLPRCGKPVWTGGAKGTPRRVACGWEMPCPRAHADHENPARCPRHGAVLIRTEGPSWCWPCSQTQHDTDDGGEMEGEDGDCFCPRCVSVRALATPKEPRT